MYYETILDIISRYTTLEKDGKSGRYYGVCPFCKDPVKTLFIDRDVSRFFCYGCGAHGGKKDFEARISGKPKPASPAAPKDPVLMAICEDAACFYFKRLTGSKNAGSEYLKRRGLGREDFEQFGLGYAPEGYESLYRALSGKYRVRDLTRSGLVRIGKNGRPYDFFRGRVLFPIMDENGDVIAFGGRVTDDGKPKYINSPETEIFSKRSSLYGFPYTVEKRGGMLILCEGYMDYVTVRRSGFADCAAVLGTAITEEHAAMIGSRYKNVCLALDSDGPGIHAVKTSIRTLNEAGITVTVPDFRPVKDPDEFIRTFGAESFAERINHALPSDVFTARHADNIGEVVDILMRQM